MNIKPHLVRGLLRLYPAEWRAEYGEELGTLLALRPITSSVFADVLLSASRERLKREQVWKICGGALFAWTVFGAFINNSAPLSDGTYESYKRVWEIIVLLTGCLTILLKRSGSPCRAAVKAALLGFVPEIVALTLWISGIFHPLLTNAAGPFPLLECRLAMFEMTFPTVPQPGFVMVPFAIVVIVIRAGVIGIIGGLLGRVILFFSPRVRLC
ncbi:MAG: hypothetical protein WBY44_27055 [Bryobacteraceae bacterium]